MNKTLLHVFFVLFIAISFTNQASANNDEQSRASQQVVKVININSADQQTLMEIKGIGEKKALAIIEYRDAYGAFSTVEEITNVKGIGKKFLEKNKERLTL
ncbi:ComEA family DNA-binding protein [Flocculibacter collagenilyticus]|uniref:ComEA family DNA-binding protein n=1 Tax=Flocculibacter collagenilyticus TaxID=2744479 RepID=UPI0018F69B4C|nr:ComEA family DNA-binding protein [Flocculibacter collagenilyticus]